MTPVLRQYQPADLAALYALDVLCFAKPFRFSRSAMRGFAQAPNAIVHIAAGTSKDAGERILGFCIVHLEPEHQGLTAYVLTLDVAPDSRGQGVATMLMHSVEAVAAGKGATSALLHVFLANANARRLYERLGYKVVEHVRHFYGPGRHALLYRKPLVSEESSTADRGGAAPARP